MSRYFLAYIFTFALCISVTVPASAHLYEWSDPVSGMTVRVPDKWRIVPNENVEDIVTFRAPGQNEHAGCRIRATDDARYSIYPESLSDHVNNVYLDDNFWNTLGEKEFRGYWINNTQKSMGLGNGFAHVADMTYVPMNRPMNKRALIWASLYHNKLYMLECASEYSVFYDWYPTFQYVLSTVRMKKEIHELPTGYYRYFLGDPVLQVNTVRGQTSRH